ncbi:hypothetical protein TCAL_00660 [Tigriopus californicus]|uniref:RNA helicase aquarius n=2 Tax=Tigriopus californicus TaxID=6832 RepID=A0A553PBR8_TIGCA|nr:hypothetical protein TCAL_00660 [Tigriopus californicus]
MERVSMSFVEYKIFPTQPSQDCLTLMAECLKVCQPFLHKYIWHMEPFRLKPVQEEHLYGKVYVGDNVEDEWFIISLLKYLSYQLPDSIVIRVLDEDGEILLIEAADHLPSWAQEPDLAEKRVYLYQGQVHLIPISDRPSSLTPLPSGVPREGDAVKTIVAFSHITRASPEVQECIDRRLGSYPRDWSSELHYCHLVVPKVIAHVLRESPQLISPAIQKLHDLDPQDSRMIQKMERFPQGPEKDLVTVGMGIPRCLYAMLSGSKIFPYKKSDWTLPGAEDAQFKAKYHGFKVAAGLEVMTSTQRNISHRSANDPAFDKFLKALNSLDYFQGLLPGSKEYEQFKGKARDFYRQDHPCDEIELENTPLYSTLFTHALATFDPSTPMKPEDVALKPADSDNWLDINPNVLDDLLAQRFLSKSRNDGTNISDLEHFLQESSDMKGVEGSRLTQGTKTNEGGISFDSNLFESALDKVLGMNLDSTDHSDSDDSESEREHDANEDDMRAYFEALEDQLKESNVTSDDLDLSQSAMRGDFRKRAHLPHNREGRIAPYSRDGRPGDRRRPHNQNSDEPSASTKFKSRGSAPTLDQIQADRLTDLANSYWAPHTLKKHKDFDPQVIRDVYSNDLRGTDFSIKRIMMLEFSQYFENYLWPNFSLDASNEHVLSVILMINEKFRERVPAWNSFQLKSEHFTCFFEKVLKLSLEDKSDVTLQEQKFVLVFLDHCFTSMEIDLIRVQVQKLVSLPMWASLLERRREFELKRIPKWRKYWKALQKKDAKESEEAKAKNEFDRHFLRKLIQRFLSTLDSIQEKDANPWAVEYCEHFLVLLIDLEALLPTRRFFDTLLDDSQVLAKCSLSSLAKREEGRLFAQLLNELKFYARFEISNETGDQLTEKQNLQLHYDKITSLQKAIFSRYPEMRKFALATVASIDDRESLTRHFGPLSKETLYKIAEFLCLVPELGTVDLKDFDEAVLREALILRHERKDSQLQALNELPLYPTEEVIWDENIVPGEFYNGEGVLALPKLNLQFLTLQDYLLRNFKLFQLESTYEIRGDVEDAVTRLKPWRPEDATVIFNGWARMAQPIVSFSIVEVAKPNIGEKQPSRVRADVSVNLSVKDNIKAEWENLRRHDVCFLVTVRPKISPHPVPLDFTDDFIPQVGLMYVRGCEVEGMLDENGRVIEEGPEPRPNLPGESRTYRILLDCNQYHQDMEKTSNGSEDVYESFNILMRRKPKENNFKAVLETIRELMNTSCVVPDFLHDIILGYGDPGAAHYRQMENQIKSLNFNDTFLSFDHLRQSFPNYDVTVDDNDKDRLVPPFKLEFKEMATNPGTTSETASEAKPSIKVTPFQPQTNGPFIVVHPKKNSVPFTPTQVEAIRAGMNPGLTMVVGPPGTGKTDVAVQIISNIYHNFPDQRTLIVTHSNQALNQLFEKIMSLDVDERHLLRLGHGEEALETEKDFSRYGRVNYVLAKRLELLDEVSRLQKSLDVRGDVAYTCETSGYFFLYEILSRWEKYETALKTVSAQETQKLDTVAQLFPFSKFFDKAPQPLFKKKSLDEDRLIAESCWRYIQDIFTQLEEFRAFELLRSGLDRTRYLVVKEAKIVAMTCTHAALKRKELASMGFKFDNILMEEAAQILEIETFIPLLLQNPEDGYNRLKRWIMIGDHHQLPPVIKNMAFQKFSNMEQSMFTRLVRLGVPTVDLDAQGRARPSIASLYNWRYKNLGNLSHVLNQDEFMAANGGFSFDYQLINVPDFNGVGESQPSPFFYQNLAEAEFVVATFMYMRLIGYPAEKISILTTYNGQKHLIRDVVNARCSNNPMVGTPHKITTVDKFQGQQNDYILLSLVRTYNVGHLRDVRRLVVAMSRARYGLYVFARVNLFKNCFELQPAFNILTKRPLQLHLCPNEVYRTKRQANVTAPNPLVISDMPAMCKFVYDFYAGKVAALQSIQPPSLGEQDKPGEIAITKPDGKTAQHPADDRDSDDEAEGRPNVVMKEIVNEVSAE